MRAPMARHGAASGRCTPPALSHSSSPTTPTRLSPRVSHTATMQQQVRSGGCTLAAGTEGWRACARRGAQGGCSGRAGEPVPVPPCLPLTLHFLCRPNCRMLDHWSSGCGGDGASIGRRRMGCSAMEESRCPLSAVQRRQQRRHVSCCLPTPSNRSPRAQRSVQRLRTPLVCCFLACCDATRPAPPPVVLAPHSRPSSWHAASSIHVACSFLVCHWREEQQGSAACKRQGSNASNTRMRAGQSRDATLRGIRRLRDIHLALAHSFF